jgi:hypothetical protein
MEPSNGQAMVQVELLTSHSHIYQRKNVEPEIYYLSTRMVLEGHLSDLSKTLV